MQQSVLQHTLWAVRFPCPGVSRAAARRSECPAPYIVLMIRGRTNCGGGAGWRRQRWTLARERKPIAGSGA